MYSPIRRNTRKQGNTSAFDRKLSYRLIQVQEDRQIKIKRRKKSRQEGADVKKQQQIVRMYRQIKNDVIKMTKIQEEHDLPM